MSGRGLYLALLAKMKKLYSLARLHGDIEHDILEELVEEILAFSDSSPSLLRYIFCHPRQGPYIFHHSLHVTLLSILIARQCQFSDERLKELTLSALLHDVGRLRISLDVLGKKEPLSEKRKSSSPCLIGFSFFTTAACV